MRNLLKLTVLAVAWSAGGVPALAQSPIEGTWRSAGLTEITITPCETAYCGHISKIVVPPEIAAEHAGASALPPEQLVDGRNKDPNLRSRPILGLQILTLAQSDESHIFNGEIYNPQDGNIYSGYVEMVSPDQLRLNGCVLFNIICRGEDWVRATP